MNLKFLIIVWWDEFVWSCQCFNIPYEFEQWINCFLSHLTFPVCWYSLFYQSMIWEYIATRLYMSFCITSEMRYKVLFQNFHALIPFIREMSLWCQQKTYIPYIWSNYQCEMNVWYLFKVRFERKVVVVFQT